MHSCGHDGHTAMGLTIARWVKDNAEKLNGKIKLIFQPAEEGVRGAAAQAASGQLDDVDYLIGSHLALMCKSGEICTYPTNVLSTTKLDVKLFGKPAHPTMSPELGRNALACLCTCVSELLAMAGHSKGMSCINVGHIEAGEFRNVIPATGLIQLEVRGSTAEINDYMVQQATRLIQGTCLAYGVDYDITKAGEATELVNDEGLVELVNKVAKNTEGVHTVVREKEMSGSEDFTVLAARVRAHGGKTEFFILGSDRAGAHHQKNFDFDETSLRVGFDIYTKCLEELNG